MKIDSTKIDKTLETLNQGDTAKPWIAVDGYNAVTQVSIDTDPPTFFADSGIMIKAFVNRNTGELRFYPLLIFKLEEKAAKE